MLIHYLGKAAKETWQYPQYFISLVLRTDTKSMQVYLNFKLTLSPVHLMLFCRD